MPFRHARARLPDCISIIGQIRQDLHVRFYSAGCPWPGLGYVRLILVFGFFRPHDVNCGSIEQGLDVRCVIFLDHLDASTAVLSNLVDVGTFHQPQTDVCMPQTVRGTRSAFAVEAKIFLIEDGLEKFALPFRKNEVRRSGRAPLFARDSGGLGRFCGRVHAINARRAEPALKSLKGQHRTRHTFAISDAALSADFNLQDRFIRIPIMNDGDIPKLKAPGLVGPQSSIDCEEHIVMKLLCFPFEASFLRLLRALPRRRVEFLVFFWREPRTMRDFLGMTGTAPRNRAGGRAIRGAAQFSGLGVASQFPDAWCCVPAACRV